MLKAKNTDFNSIKNNVVRNFIGKKMTHSDSGYVKDLAYSYGYFSELNPQNIKLKFLSAGFLTPEFGTACELGFGQGLSVNIHAAASLCTWYGTDFNESQASFAKEIAVASKAKIHLFGEAFSEFTNRDLPDFDYIGLHGIWSWVSDENRQIIVDFIRKKLKVGGVAYIGYNTLPGWAAFAPMRNLMKLHLENSESADNEIFSHIDSSIEFAEKLLSTKPLFGEVNPLVSERIKKIKKQNPTYLAHEYFNDIWNPSLFNTIAEWLSEADLSYACSASYLDHVDVVNLTKEQLTFLAEIKNPVFKETVRDFMINRYFRRDYWVKKAKRLTPIEQIQELRNVRLLMTAYRPEVKMKIDGSLGEAILTENIYAPILNLMADYKIRSIFEIEEAVKEKGIDLSQLLEIILVLCHQCTFSIVQEDKEITKSKATTANLNSYLIHNACNNKEIVFLASPVTGGGVNVNWFQQMFLLAIQKGMEKPEEWASFVKQMLDSQGQTLVRNGKLLKTAEEKLSHLSTQANEFAVKFLPILRALHIELAP